jgi:hypothetical protein
VGTVDLLYLVKSYPQSFVFDDNVIQFIKKSHMGNTILYYKPKTKNSPTYLKAVLGKKGEPTYPAPGTFLKTNFKTTLKAPFGMKGALNNSIVFRRLDLIRAALECGYGRRNFWTASLALGATGAAGMRRYLHSRLEMAVSCIEINAKGAWSVLPFYEKIEASEKTALSFIFGGMGAYLVARTWLKSGGDSLSLCLHVGIYAKGANPSVFFPVGSPDFLVRTKDKKWHVFESKGGVLTSRYRRVVEGLAQLATVGPVCWFGDFPQTPKTAVCVHTSVDSSQEFSLVAYDPPADHGDEDEDEDEDGRNLENKRPVELIKGVCKLLLLLETLDHYKLMAAGEEIANEPNQQKLWTFRKSGAFGGLVVGIPTRYLENERKVREQMAVYLSALEAAHEMQGGGIDLFRQALDEKLEILQLPALSPEVIRYLEQRKSDNRNTVFDEPHDFFPGLARVLQLEELSDELMIQSEESVVSTLVDAGRGAITTGGMYIRIQPDPIVSLG